MSDWVQWQPIKSVRRTGPHALVPFGKKSRIAYRYCARCGIVTLRNDATRKVLRAMCQWQEDLT